MFKRVTFLLSPFLMLILAFAVFNSLFVTVPNVSAADQLYVDATLGSNVTGDGSIAQPWQTVTFALAQVTGPNTEIRVAAGLYNSALGESFPLVMKPGVQLVGANRETTILSGNPSNNVVHFPGTSYYTETTSISGFKVMNGFYGVFVSGRVGTPSRPLIENNWTTANVYGILNLAVTGQSVDSIIRNNLVEFNTNQGIGISASCCGTYATGTVDNNTVTNNGRHGIACYSHGLGNIGSSDNAHCEPIVRNNYVANNGLSGFECRTQRVAACNPVLIGNQFLANEEMAIARNHINGYSLASAPMLINNILANNELGGVAFLAGDRPVFVNNTVAYNGEFGIHGGLPTIVNSIIWGHVDDLDAPVGQVAYSDVGDPEYASFNNNLSEDPLFVDIATLDFHLQHISPLVDMGDSDYPDLPMTDFEGDPRIWNFGIDIGADERHNPVFWRYMPILFRFDGPPPHPG